MVFTDNLADHDQLRGGVYFVDTFPYTRALGKVLRSELRLLANKMYTLRSE